jgi:hypothetical protein
VVPDDCRLNRPLTPCPTRTQPVILREARKSLGAAKSHYRAIVAALALAVLSYVAGYLLLSDPARCAVGHEGGCTTWVEPNYRVGGDAAEGVFRPLEILDRRVRPAFWATRRFSYEAKPGDAPVEGPAVD